MPMLADDVWFVSLHALIRCTDERTARPTTTIIHRPAMRRMANQDVILLERAEERTIGRPPFIRWPGVTQPYHSLR